MSRKDKLFIQSILVPISAPRPWIGEVQYDGAPEAFRGQFEHRQFGAGSQRSKENTEQSQFLATHGESMGYSCFRCRGGPGSTRRDGSLHRVTVHPRLSAGDRRNGHRAMTTIEGRGTTERQNYQNKPNLEISQTISITYPTIPRAKKRTGKRRTSPDDSPLVRRAS